MPKNKPITTNDVEPLRPIYPAPGQRKPAAGPMITTRNIEQIREQAKPAETDAPKKIKRGRA